MTKIELILSDETFMKYSQEVFKKMQISKEKSGKPLTDKMEWRIVNKEIKKKLKNSKKIKGICCCNDDLLCEHRKKYIEEAVNGKTP